MNLFERWRRKLWVSLAYKFFHLGEIENFVEATDERYLDERTWAKIRGISTKEARQQLKYGVDHHYLSECLLYEWPDSPVHFLVPESFLGQQVRLSDIGYIGEDDDREVTISSARTRKVFVAGDIEPTS